MRSSLIATALLSAALSGCGGGGPSGSSDGTLTIDNASSHVLTEVRVADVDQVSWGPNLLRDVLYPDERLVVSVRCGTYDVLVVDDRGRQCGLGNLDLCFADRIWTLDNATLRSCGF